VALGKGNIGAMWRGVGTGEGLSRLGFGLRHARRGFRLGVPDRLYIAPQEIAQADPATATDIYSGHLILAGRSVMTRGVSPFLIEPPSIHWANELHGFEWLRHFRDSDNAVVRQHARALVAEWLTRRSSPEGAAWRRPSVTARRVQSWLVNSPLLLEGADHGFYRQFLRALAADALRLEAFASSASAGPGRLLCAIAHACYALCALNSERDWNRVSRALGEAISASVHPDGAPLSRNPADVIEALAFMLPLRNAYTARGRTPPAELQPGIDRLMQFLRMMRHPSGAIALFNGMGATRLDQIGAIFAFDDALGAAPPAAPYGGYHRLEAAGSILIADAGAPPPPAHAYAATVGTLAFEFSSGRERIVVNCGAAPPGLDDLREALRESAAHSTLSVEGASALSFAAGGDPEGLGRRLAVARGAAPGCSRESTPDGEALAMNQSSWQRAYGFVHERRLLLSSDGAMLAGIDETRVTARRRKQPGPMVLRFHLHPTVRAAVLPESGGVRLQLADGSVWMFAAEGAVPVVEESIFLGGLEMQRRCQQIVVAAPGPGVQIRWSFARSSGPRPA
jgi:uncharacterized heparinase superfamily protein